MLDTFRISTRIAGGFGIAIALLLALAVLTYTAANRLGGIFTDYRQQVLSSDVGADLRNATRLAQLAVAEFRADPSQATSAAISDAFAELPPLAEALLQISDDTEERAAAEAVIASLGTLTQHVESYRAAALDGQAEQADVTDLGIRHRRGIGRLRAALEERGATEPAFDALRASDSFLVTRVRIDRFFAGWPEGE